MHLIAVALGGALGAVSRSIVQSKLADMAGFGFINGTFVVNIIGSFLMGFVALALVDRVGPEWRSFIAVGFLGSFTTFSTFSGDLFKLIDSGAYVNALGYGMGSVFLGLVGFLLGSMAARGLG